MDLPKMMQKKIYKKKRKVSSNSIRNEISKLAITGSLDGYPDYHNLPTKADKILWLMQYVDVSGIKGLTAAEIDYLSTELKDRIKANEFTAHNARNIKKSFITKTSNGFLIQKKGLDRLKELMQSKN